jgi:hypothetical protein
MKNDIGKFIHPCKMFSRTWRSKVNNRLQSIHEQIQEIKETINDYECLNMFLKEYINSLSNVKMALMEEMAQIEKSKE